MNAKTLATLIDQTYELRQQRLAAQKEVDALEAQEKELRAQLFDLLRHSPSEAATGAVAQAKITHSIVPQLVDADEFFAWVRKSPSNRAVAKISVSTPEWRTRVAAGTHVPGVESFTKDDLSLTKAK